ncbi:response regulator [Pedomonas mirosovicensis]|uniref:response regulator n=1 Tax=Pedomonas mirosovicensis TaxID=2908641 RepID=UPI002168D0F7|nr:response regulator [Pedomonas mirosovicensis]MCH8684996.1 response regulator [Pedomonas mirosovicensis]
MANAAAPLPTLEGLRALVVEDETLVAIFLEDLLEELGCVVVGCAGQVARALALIEALQPDIAIIDINLAGEPAYPIAEAMKQRGAPFIFATGYGDGAVSPEWQDWPVLHKPYQQSDLEQALVKALARRVNV